LGVTISSSSTSTSTSSSTSTNFSVEDCLQEIIQNQFAITKYPLGWLLKALNQTVQVMQDRAVLRAASDAAVAALTQCDTTLSNWIKTLLEVEIKRPLPPHDTMVSEFAFRLLTPGDASTGARLAVERLRQRGEDGGWDILRDVLSTIVFDRQQTKTSIDTTTDDTYAVLGATACILTTKEDVAHILLEWDKCFFDHNSINTGAKLQHCTLLGQLCSLIGVTGNPNPIPESLLEPAIRSVEQNSFAGRLRAQQQHIWMMAAAVPTNNYHNNPAGLSHAHAHSQSHRLTWHSHLLQNREFLIGINDLSSLVKELPKRVPNDERVGKHRKNATSMLMSDWLAVRQRMQSRYVPVWDFNAAMVEKLLRHSKTTKEKTVEWLCKCIELQNDRCQSRVSLFRETSDSFSLNMFAILLRLFQPMLQIGDGHSRQKVDAMGGVDWSRMTKVEGDTFFASPGILDTLYPLTDTTRLRVPEDNDGWIATTGHSQFQHGRHIGNRAFDVSSSSSSSSTSTTSGLTSSGSTSSTSHSFGTTCFMLASKAMKQSLAQVFNNLDNMMNHASQLSRGLPSLDDDDDSVVETEETVLRRKIVMGYRSVFTIRTIEATQPDLLSRTLNFCSFTASWLLRAIGYGGSGNTGDVWRPAAATPSSLGRVPQEMLETIIDVMSFYAKMKHFSRDTSLLFNQNTLIPNRWNLCVPLVRLFTALLLGGEIYVKSPHVRTKIGDLICDLFFDEHSSEEENEVSHSTNPADIPLLSLSLLTNDRFVVASLLPGMIEVYGRAAEESGYYEVQRHRSKYTVVIKYLLAIPSHRAALVKYCNMMSSSMSSSESSESSESSTSPTPMSREHSHGRRLFDYGNAANGLLSEANDAIISGMTMLKDIKIHQDRARNVQVYHTLHTVEERAEFEKEYESNVKNVRHKMSRCTQALDMIRMLTTHVPFPTKLLRQLAATSMQTLHTIVASSAKIHVDEPARYYFYPKKILRYLVLIVLNNQSDEFTEELAQYFCDGVGGGVNASMLDKTTNILERKGILHSDADGLILLWRTMSSKVQKLAEAKKAEEMEMEEVPDEFMCQLMCTTMSDPVKLMPGGQVVDRSSIEAALRSGSNTNPYTRQPLKTEDLVPMPALKVRIDAWFVAQKERVSSMRA